MKSTVEALEGNKVKLSVEVEAAEFEKAVDSAFRRIAREVRIPGFRPGKAPRKVLEARLGTEYARNEALREALPEYYSEAVRTHDVDVIDSPEIDITAGEDAGDVSFDAVVEVRPSVTLAGYADLRVTVERPEVTDDELERRIDAFRTQFSELVEVDRPADEGDHVTIDIAGSLRDEPLPGLTADGYLYEIGSSGILPEVDDHLIDASTGDVLEFAAAHPDPDEDDELWFRIEVKDVKERVLPELTDEFVSEHTEFDGADAYRADLTDRILRQKRAEVRMTFRHRVGEAVAELVVDEIPEALVRHEMDGQLQNMAMRLSAQGLSIEQYLSVTGRNPDDLRAELRSAAEPAARLDLALRALAEAEAIEVTDEEVDAEFAQFAERMGVDLGQVREQFESGGQVSAVRSDLRKQKAFEWLLEQVHIVDTDGNPVDRAELEAADDEADDEAGDTDEAAPAGATQPVATAPGDTTTDDTDDTDGKDDE